MISYTEVRNAYNNLYKEMRNYIWDIPVVEALVDLELASYQTCLDMSKVETCFNALKREVLTYVDDPDLVSAFDKFQSLIDKHEDPYVKLFRVSEVLV